MFKTMLSLFLFSKLSEKTKMYVYSIIKVATSLQIP